MIQFNLISFIRIISDIIIIIVVVYDDDDDVVVVLIFSDKLNFVQLC